MFPWSVCITVVYLVSASQAADAEEWRSRVIYHVLTDRFATSDETPPTEPCNNLRDWCGGTWKGITNNLDYIQNLGADAIWISPIVLNNPHSYHGYHALDIFQLDPHFGTEDDLMELVSAAHEKDMWIMVDIVPNHMGHQDGCDDFSCDEQYWPDFDKFVPFNKPEHYHDFCPIDWSTEVPQHIMEECRLAFLPDLNQTVPYVRQALLDHIANLTMKYDFDGYRVDTVKHIEKSFWGPYQEAAGIFCMGEVWNEDNFGYVADYQGEDGLDSVFNFPLHGAIKAVFGKGESMTVLEEAMKSTTEHFADPSVLGVFVDNHDMARFLNGTNDVTLLRNALTYVIFAQGIPIIYYGTEQGFSGGNDPYCRENLWPDYNQDSDLYQFIKTNLDFRRDQQDVVISSDHVDLVADDDVLVFSRANHKILVALTNSGEDEGGSKTVDVTGLPFETGSKFSHIMTPSDELEVVDGTVTIELTEGSPKVYHLTSEAEKSAAPISQTGCWQLAGLLVGVAIMRLFK